MSLLAPQLIGRRRRRRESICSRRQRQQFPSAASEAEAQAGAATSPRPADGRQSTVGARQAQAASSWPALNGRAYDDDADADDDAAAIGDCWPTIIIINHSALDALWRRDRARANNKSQTHCIAPKTIHRAGFAWRRPNKAARRHTNHRSQQDKPAQLVRSFKTIAAAAAAVGRAEIAPGGAAVAACVCERLRMRARARWLHCSRGRERADCVRREWPNQTVLSAARIEAARGPHAGG